MTIFRWPAKLLLLTSTFLLNLTAPTTRAMDLAAATHSRYELRQSVIPPLAQPRYFPQGFIRVHGSAFVDSQCNEFVPTGWNIWGSPILEQAMAALEGDPVYQTIVDTLFYGASVYGMNIMRIFGVGVPGKHVLQPAAGVYDEKLFRAFDYILDRAATHNVKVLWAMTTHWQDNDGPGAYLEWCGICSTWEPSRKCTSEQRDLFWVNECAIRLFQQHMAVVVNRINTVNGKRYGNDPVFIGWNLYNEPRCPHSQSQDKSAYCFPAVLQWTNIMSQYLKQIDPNHLVSWGHEGFFGHFSQYAPVANPFGTPRNVQPGWSGYVGQDFEGQTAVPWIDFGTFHMWPDNWNSTDPANAINWINQWLEAHNQAAAFMRKPVILEEFGKRSMPWETAWVRDPYYTTVYQYIEQVMSGGGWLKGDLFWNWDPYAQQQISWGNTIPPSPNMLPPSANAVRNSDTTFTVVRTHTAKMSYYNGRNHIGLGCTVVNTSG